jgi:hypothetical protein
MTEQGDLAPEIAEGDAEAMHNSDTPFLIAPVHIYMEDYGTFSLCSVQYENAKRRGSFQPTPAIKPRSQYL